MTPQEFALQVAAIGGAQVGNAVLTVLPWAAVAVAFGIALYRFVRWEREMKRAYPQRYERPAPLIASAPEGHGCDWCDDRLPAGRCDCTGDCGRWCCMAGSTVTARKADADLEREISEMVRRYGRG